MLFAFFYSLLHALALDDMRQILLLFIVLFGSLALVLWLASNRQQFDMPADVAGGLMGILCYITIYQFWKHREKLTLALVDLLRAITDRLRGK